jgi:hypothetical protein
VLGAILLVTAGLAPAALQAQLVVLDGPNGATLPSVTPTLEFRASGLGPARPLEVRIQISTTPDFVGLVLDSTITSADTAFTVQVTRPLPSETQVYWRARARALAGLVYESVVTGPRAVPAWLQLVTPNSPTGNSFDIRRPLFVWRSAPVTAATGPWRYDVELTSAGRPEVGVAGLSDTTFRPAIDLQANTSYRWSVRAFLRNGESVRVASAGSFVITDPPLPTTTLLYQNFPNPFPTANAFATCFWFDVGEPGATVSLDVLDLRGNLVKTIVPASDGVRDFTPGRYGRGLAGGASNCDNRFVWDATANDGRTVAPGVYLARFRAGTGAPIFRRIVFVGR